MENGAQTFFDDLQLDQNFLSESEFKKRHGKPEDSVLEEFETWKATLKGDRQAKMSDIPACKNDKDFMNSKRVWNRIWKEVSLELRKYCKLLKKYRSSDLGWIVKDLHQPEINRFGDFIKDWQSTVEGDLDEAGKLWERVTAVENDTWLLVLGGILSKVVWHQSFHTYITKNIKNIKLEMIDQKSNVQLLRLLSIAAARCEAYRAELYARCNFNHERLLLLSEIPIDHKSYQTSFRALFLEYLDNPEQLPTVVRNHKIDVTLAIKRGYMMRFDEILSDTVSSKWTENNQLAGEGSPVIAGKDSKKIWEIITSDLIRSIQMKLTWFIRIADQEKSLLKDGVRKEKLKTDSFVSRHLANFSNEWYRSLRSAKIEHLEAERERLSDLVTKIEHLSESDLVQTLENSLPGLLETNYLLDRMLKNIQPKIEERVDPKEPSVETKRGMDASKLVFSALMALTGGEFLPRFKKQRNFLTHEVTKAGSVWGGYLRAILRSAIEGESRPWALGQSKN